MAPTLRAANLGALPFEVLNSILEPLGDEVVTNNKSVPVHDDPITAGLHALCLVNKRLNAAATPQLYRAVSVTKASIHKVPCVLYTILQKPALANCIQRLDVGSADLLGHPADRMKRIAECHTARSRKRAHKRDKAIGKCLQNHLHLAAATLLVFLAPGITHLNVAGEPNEYGWIFPHGEGPAWIPYNVTEALETPGLAHVAEAIKSTLCPFDACKTLPDLQHLTLSPCGNDDDQPALNIAERLMPRLLLFLQPQRLTIKRMRCLIAAAHLFPEPRPPPTSGVLKVAHLDLFHCGLSVPDVCRTLACCEPLETFRISWTYMTQKERRSIYNNRAPVENFWELVGALKPHRLTLKKLAICLPWKRAHVWGPMMLPGALTNFPVLESLVIDEDLLSDSAGCALPRTHAGLNDLATTLDQSLPSQLLDLQIHAAKPDVSVTRLCEVVGLGFVRSRLALHRVAVTFPAEDCSSEAFATISELQARGEVAVHLYHDVYPASIRGEQSFVVTFGQTPCSHQLQWCAEYAKLLVELENDPGFWRTAVDQRCEDCLTRACKSEECKAPRSAWRIRV